MATGARLALYGGGGYLRDRIIREPATRVISTKAVHSMATTLQDLGINYLAGSPAFAQDLLRQTLDSQIAEVGGLCR
jgi:hypothetical protein